MADGGVVSASVLTPSGYVFEPTADPPWPHQLEAFRRFADDPYFALFFEQRCGKTRPTLDVAAYLYERGAIDSVLILAWPNGVHSNWIREEVPKWLPHRVPRRCLIWRSGQQRGKAFKQEWPYLLRSKGLAILSVNAEAITVQSCRDHIREFLSARKGVMLVVDESDWASSPGSLRTEKVLALSAFKVIKVKALLGGTPATESPFQLFSQMNILRPNFFGFRSYVTFRHHFGEYEWEEAPVQEPLKVHGKVQRYKNGHVILTDKLDEKGRSVIAIDKRTGRPKMRPKKELNHTTSAQYEALLRDDAGNPRYRNLDELHARMAPHVMRVTRDQVSAAPKPIFSKHYYQMSKEQLRVYEELREEYQAELRSGYIVEAAHVLTRWLRLQQVLSNRLSPREEGMICGDCNGAGCVECDDVGIVVKVLPEEVVDPESDPRLDALRFVIRDPPPKTIVWARFQHEVTAVYDLIRSMGGSPVRFDGLVPERERLENLHGAFRRGSAGFLVGNPAAGQRGLPMHEADLAVFFSNYFSGRMREQVEARTEALFKATSTHLVDIVCEGSIDEKLVAVLRAKKSLRAVIMRDNLDEWL